jgi:hypothetical protein
MLQNLPWEIQRSILQFGVKEDLHKELKKKAKVYHQFKEEIQTSRFRNYLEDCQPGISLDSNPSWIKEICRKDTSLPFYLHVYYLFGWD